MAKKDKETDIKKYANYEESWPKQLMFPFLQEDDRKSNTIELFDMLPLYVWGKVKRTKEGLLSPIRRHITHKDSSCNVILAPAHIEQKDGDFKAFFPGEKEFTVMQVLRYFLSQGRHVFLDGQATVKFTLYQVQKFLTEHSNEGLPGKKKKAPPIRIETIKEALLVLSKTNVEIKNSEGTTEFNSNIITSLGLTTKKDWKDLGKDTQCYAVLHPLITKAILEGNHRPYYIGDVLSYKKALSKYLHLRMAHNFIQASVLNEYTIDLVTWFEGAGVRVVHPFRENIREAEKALKEMLKIPNSIMMKHTKTLKKEGRTITGCKFHIMPSVEFSHIAREEDARRKKLLHR